MKLSVLLGLLAGVLAGFAGALDLTAEDFLTSKVYEYGHDWDTQLDKIKKVEIEERCLDPKDANFWSPLRIFPARRKLSRICLGEGRIGQARYLLTFVFAPQAGNFTISAGADYLLRILVNGKVVEEGRAMPGTPRPAQVRYNVEFHQGWNSLMLKTGSGVMGYDLWLTVSGTDGLRASPYAGLQQPAPRTVGKKPEIMLWRFPDGREGMLALTFDGGTPDHRTVAAPALKKRGLRGSFYIAPDMLGKTQGTLGWGQVREIAAMGHEIGNHTLSQARLPELIIDNDFMEFAHQCSGAAARIKKEIKVFPRTLCFPWDQSSSKAREWLRASGCLPMRLRVVAPGVAEECWRFVDEIADGRYAVVAFHSVNRELKDIFPQFLDAVKSAESYLYSGTYWETESYFARWRAAKLTQLATTDENLYRLDIAKEGLCFAFGAVTVALRHPDHWQARINGVAATPVRQIPDWAFYNLFPGDVIGLRNK